MLCVVPGKSSNDAHVVRLAQDQDVSVVEFTEDIAVLFDICDLNVKTCTATEI